MNNYFIKSGYITNVDDFGGVVQPYTSVPVDTTFQVDVYKYAAKLMTRYDIKNVLELGCGSGHKLVKYIYPVCKDITGIDQQFSISYLDDKHSVGRWLHDDFDSDEEVISKKYDLILSIDVIEHLVYPENLLKRIKQFAHNDTHIILSTPERDLVRGLEHMGPSPNRKHVREWNESEFYKFILDSGFDVLEHRCVNSKTKSTREIIGDWILRKSNRTCQLLHARLSN